MDNRIYEKLNGISDLQDRVLLKKIMNSVFKSLEEYSEEKFNKLEKRVFDEVPYIKEKYNIYSTIIKREKIDPTDDFLYPMLQEDMEEKTYDTREILKALREKNPINMFKIFVECDYLIFNEFINSDLTIKGVIETDKKVHEAYFKVARNKQYTDKVSKLYRSFINTNIAWTTINNPYVHKIADVILVGCEEEIERDEKVIKIDVDFGEYNNYVKYDMVPLWNIKELCIKCNGFPVPCIDKINYEHNISILKEGTENGYLVDCEDSDVNYVTLADDSIIISSNISEGVYWNIWSVIAYDQSKVQKNEYPLMSNKVNVNFSNKLSFQKSYTIKTKTDIARAMNCFKDSEYLKFVKVELQDSYKQKTRETYEVNDFIIDEIRDENSKKSLILYFEPKDKGNYLNKDILSFLVSQAQLIYPEYKCEGRLL